jgi:hypothetical protein
VEEEVEDPAEDDDAESTTVSGQGNEVDHGNDEEVEDKHDAESISSFDSDICVTCEYETEEEESVQNSSLAEGSHETESRQAMCK